MTKRHFFWVAIGWTAFAVYGSLVPLDYLSTDFNAAVERFRNLPPLTFGIGTRSDWATNVLLFIPLTFCWMGAFVCDRGWPARIIGALFIIPAGAMTSVSVEFAQLFFNARTPSRNDIAGESIGGFLGVVLWLVAGPRFVSWLRSYGRATSSSSQMEWLLQAYVLGFVIYAVLPLDLTLSISDLYFKYKSGQVVLIPFTFHYKSATVVVYQFAADILLFVPIGAWLLVREQARGRAWPLPWLGLLGGLSIAGAIEVAQFLVLSRYTDTTDIVLGTIGIAAGVQLASRLGSAQVGEKTGPDAPLGRGAPWVVAILGYSLFLAIGFLVPFDYTTDRESIRSAYAQFFRVPFFALYWSNVFTATTQLLLRLLLFAPLGALWGTLAARMPSRGTAALVRLLGIGYAALLAFAIEGAQIFMPSKVADSTEVVLCLVGALAGLYVASRFLRASPQRDF
ncbi:MAG: VanZ family protein [Vicinamibacterales bacterium]